MEEGILVGAFVGVIVMIFFSDMIGRRKIVLYALVVGIVSLIVIVTVESPWVKFIALILWGAAADVNFVVALSTLPDIIAY